MVPVEHGHEAVKEGVLKEGLVVRAGSFLMTPRVIGK